MHSYEEIIKNNLQWSEEIKIRFPDYFKELSGDQSPPFLYIGCSDSRLPLSIFTQTNPGEIFVHRNIANQVKPGDPNFLAVLEFAVDVLKVKHIIVAGHYDCGGIKAAVKNSAVGYVKKWIKDIRKLYLKSKNELNISKDFKEECDLLSELNVIKQIENLLKTRVIKNSIKNKTLPQLHGWIINIYNGEIKELALPIAEWKEKKLI
ncbi:MAG: carbonic anhydrase [Brevinematia bacterium]